MTPSGEPSGIFAERVDLSLHPGRRRPALMSSTGSPMLTPLEAFAQAFTSLGILALVVNTSGGIYCVEARMRDGDALIVGTTKNVWCADVVDRTRKRVDSINSNIRWQGILAERNYAGIAR